MNIIVAVSHLAIVMRNISQYIKTNNMHKMCKNNSKPNKIKWFTGIVLQFKFQ